MGPEDYDVSKAASRAMREYLTPLVERCKVDPGDDLVSDIVTAEIDGERLSDEHIYGFLRLLLPAGAETTFRAFGNCLLALLSDPPVLDRVRRDRSLIDAVIEETLRWETSVTMVNRETACPVEIAGVHHPGRGLGGLCHRLGQPRRNPLRPTPTSGISTARPSPIWPSAPAVTSVWACTWPASNCGSA